MILLALSMACQTTTTPTDTDASPPPPTEDSATPSTEWPPPSPRPADYRNADLDGDGYDDLAVGIPYQDDVGAILVYRGGPAPALDKVPDLELVGTVPGATFAVPLDLVGDLNGDGFGDLAATTPDPSHPFVSVYFGAANLALGAPLVLEEPGAAGVFGALLRGTGDVSGDGVDDLLIGSYTGFYATPGKAYLVSGGSSFTGAARTELVPQIASPSFGWAGSSAGDVDGDGRNDLVLASPDWTDPETDYVELFLGDGDGLSDQLLAGGKAFGTTSTAAGDFDGDGLDDVVIGRPNHFDDDLGWIWLYAGAAGGLAPTASAEHSEGGNGFFGAALASAGDVDGDGAPDLVVGAPHAGAAREGLAYVLFGGAGEDLVPDVILDGAGPGVGGQVGAIDLNADTLGDVIVNRQDYQDAAPDKVRIYTGGAAFDAVAETVLVGDPQDQYGAFLPGGLR